MQMRRRNSAYGGIPGYNQGTNPLEDYARNNPPPESNPPQYEDPILPGGRPPMPPAEVPPESNPPQYEDPILPGGRPPMPPAEPPQDIPPAATPPDEVPIDAGLGGGDGSGSSSGVGPANDFEPHPMYNPDTGEMVMANTYQEHLDLSALGYTHDRPGGNGDAGANDYALIGVISLLFFGGLILGIKR